MTLNCEYLTDTISTSFSCIIMETDVGMGIQETLVSINDITLSIKKELELIGELLKENGHLFKEVDTANQILSKKVQEMGMNVPDIIKESKHKNRLETNLLDTITTIVAEQSEQINN